jgi:photosystem II stability/assembly factor-like uncharacterized protein
MIPSHFPAGAAALSGGRRFVWAAAILLSAAATVSGTQWSEIDSGLPRTIAGVTSLAIDSATPSTLYAVDIDGRLFKSIDGGGSWSLPGSLGAVSFVAVDPTASSTLYAATQRGVFKSTDGGESWVGANSGLIGIGVSTIVIDPGTPATLYATTSGGIFKSTDAARNWNRLDTLPSDDFSDALIIDPVTPTTIYIVAGAGQNGLAVDPMNSSILYACVFGEVIFKSTDGGQSWNMYSLPSSGAGGNISKSTDGGQTWTVYPAAPAGAGVVSFAIDPVSSAVYAVYSSNLGWGILKSMDSGETWSALNTGLPPYPDPVGGYIPYADPVLAISPTAPATIYAGYLNRQIPSGRLAKSMDGGVTWNAADASLTYADVRALAVDPASNIYAGMGGAAYSIPLFRSADSGASWTNIAQFPAGGYAYGWISSLLVGSASPSVIYAAANPRDWYGGVFKTIDGGANWNPADLRTWDSTVMALGVSNPNTIYLGDYDPIGCGEAWVDKSVDGGSTWTPFFYEWDEGPVNAFVIDPKTPSTLYAGTPEGVFKSIDGGASWTNIGVSMGVTALTLDPGDSNTIYAAAGAIDAGFLGLFKTTDGGASWWPIDNGLGRVLDSRSTVTALAIAPNSRSTLYAATSGGGVYRSLESGGRWQPLNEGLANLDVRSLTVASNVLYAVTSGGIFKAIDDGSELNPRPPR